VAGLRCLVHVTRHASTVTSLRPNFVLTLNYQLSTINYDSTLVLFLNRPRACALRKHVHHFDVRATRCPHATSDRRGTLRMNQFGTPSRRGETSARFDQDGRAGTSPATSGSSRIPMPCGAKMLKSFSWRVAVGDGHPHVFSCNRSKSPPARCNRHCSGLRLPKYICTHSTARSSEADFKSRPAGKGQERFEGIS